MTKIILVILAVYSNGTVVDHRIPLKSYDECYYKGMNMVKKYEIHPHIQTLDLSCEKG